MSESVLASDAMTQNARDLEQELAWLAQVLHVRFQLHFDQQCAYTDVRAVAPPDLRGSQSAYARFVTRLFLSFEERVALVLALAPHIRPQCLDVFFARNRVMDRRFTEFGGIFGESGELVPTGETLAFVLGGHDLATRFGLQRLLEPRHVFVREGVLTLVPGRGQSLLQAPLRPSEEYLSLFTVGQPLRPRFGAEFPAQHIETSLGWDDLVLHPGTRVQVNDILTWATHGAALMSDWAMAAKLRPGHRSLFYGPPGTGKTMTACLLGKSSGREVYRIDLSLVISKYIGETEKNLARVFDRAEHKDWILFFDEADALFGKRSQTKDAHDRYANQEIAFLLQRIERFDGIAILATNLRENLDEAFARRFESMIYFPMPRFEERLQLWQRSLSPRITLASDIGLPRIAREHALSGGAIMNVIRHASLQALARGHTQILASDLLEGIRREYDKGGKSV